MNSVDVSPLAVLLEQGAEGGVFPSARACVLHRGKILYAGGTVSAESRFDLASVTKVLSTTALLCQLSGRKQIDIDTPLRTFFPGAAAGDVSLADLAFHRSGLPAFVPFFESAFLRMPTLRADALIPSERALARQATLEAALSIAPVTEVGQSSVYSDLGFIILGAVVEATQKTPLDELFEQLLAKPLGLTATSFRRPSHALTDDDIVKTQEQRPREPAPGQEGMWTTSSLSATRRLVDDDNAFVLDGVAGHAGLFGTADDVARFGQAVLEGQVQSPSGWSVDSTPGSTRTFGFDTPSLEGASCGSRVGRGPRGAIGHLGFTGTSLWIDFDRQLVVALLTNRTALGRHNLLIRKFRPRFHDAVAELVDAGTR